MSAIDYADRHESIIEYLAALDAFAESAGFEEYDPETSPKDWIVNVLVAMDAQLVMEEIAA